MSASAKLLLLRLKRRWKHVVVIGLLSTVFAAVCQEYDLMDMGDAEQAAYDSGLRAFTWIHKPPSERSLSDRMFGWAKKKPEYSKSVSIVSIGDPTLIQVSRDPFLRLQYGPWPYSRNVWAHLITQLHKQGASAIILDATMDEPHHDPSGDIALAEAVATGIPFYVGVNASPAVASADGGVDGVLPKVSAINRFPGVVKPEDTPSVALTEDDPFGESAEAQQAGVAALPTPLEIAKALAFPVKWEGLEAPMLLTTPQERQNGAVPLKILIPPLDPLISVVPGFGLVVTEADEDGKLRRTSFAYSDGQNTYVELGVAAVADALKAESITLSPGKLTIGDRVVKINMRGDAEINYGGTLADRFEVIPMITVLRDYWDARTAEEKGEPVPTPKVSAAKVKGRIILIGGFATGTADSKPTPLEAGTPAVVKHAAEIDSLMGGRFITEAPFWISLLLTLFISLFSAAVILVVRSTALELAWPFAMYFGFFLVTGAMLVFTDTHVLSAMPSVAATIASVFAAAINHLFADKQLEDTRKAMGRYMEPGIVDAYMLGGVEPKLGGENREITAFFSDIRGFSGFSELWRDNPQKLVGFLNDYLTRVSAVLQQHQGCVDKYIGDAVVCLFGAPFDDPLHAKNACAAALAVKEEIGRIRDECKARGDPDVYTRIGLNSDVMLVGNIGSEQMLDYTAMGDGMNLAARLEGANKNYESTIMIGENTYKQAKEFIEVRELDIVRVAGKKLPVGVYELLGMKGTVSDKMLSVAAKYHEALALFRKAQFREAVGALEQALAIDPDDGPSKMLAKRCAKYMEHPPPMPFDGIANLEK